MSTPTPQHEPTADARAGTGALWASAFILAALIILQLGRATAPAAPADPMARSQSIASLFEGRAMADLVSQVGPYTVLTFNGGNEDVLLVLDGRSEELFSYMVRNQNRLEFVGRESLPQLFASARVTGPRR